MYASQYYNVQYQKCTNLKFLFDTSKMIIICYVMANNKKMTNIKIIL